MSKQSVRLPKDVVFRHAKALDKPYKIAYEKGLYMLVTRTGKYWRMNYRFGGKQNTLALGVYDDVSLATAIAKCKAARDSLDQGIDPSEKRKQTKRQAILNTANNFEAVARRWYSTKQDDWLPDYGQKILRSLEVDAFPAIGRRPIADIRPPEVLAMLRKIEARGALETLKRVRQRCQDVFTFAVAEGLRETENPVAGLAKALKTQKAVHRPALHVRDLPEFFIRLDAARISLPVKLALRLMVLLFLRPGELRGAQWSEIDLVHNRWIVPAVRDRSRGLVGMKMREEHIVPLSNPASEIFRTLKSYSGDGQLVFPNRNDHTRPMSDGTLNSALRAMGYPNSKVSGHGFRATAASALAEMGFRKEVIDSQLSHRERNEVLGAYVHQAEYIGERARMMQCWGDHIDSLISGAQVISLREHAQAA